MRIAPEAPDDIGAGDEGLADPTQGFDGAAGRAAFQIAGDVFLDAGRLREAEDISPNVADEVDEGALKLFARRFGALFQSVMA